MIVLASGSPRRRQLLEMIGLEFRVVPPEVDESLGPAEQAEGYVTRLAREKATTVAGGERGAVVLAAYAIQGKGAALVEGIRGDFFGVMGLPLGLALELLERFGVPYSFGKADTGSRSTRP